MIPRVCNKCVLQEPFPGLSFSEDGRCCYCASDVDHTQSQQMRQRLKTKFLRLIETCRSESGYDAIMAYSGGKDSTYTLLLLTARFKLRILAITLDHGFIATQSLENIHRVTNALGIDHVMVRPAQQPLYDAFRKSLSIGSYPLKTLMRASSICNTCMHIVKSCLLRTAIEMRIPFIIYGWSPGQAPLLSSVFKTNAAMLGHMLKPPFKIVEEMERTQLASLLIKAHHLHSDLYPVIMHPLAFMGYDENQILSEIQKIGWRRPEDTDANSSNCLLNAYANQMHIQQYGFHPYSHEISTLVRQGYMNREEGLKKLAEPFNEAVIRQVEERLFI